MKLPVKPKNLMRSTDVARLIVRHWDSGWFDREATGSGGSDDPGDRAGVRSLADDLEKLGPAYIKLGQVLATRPDIAPEHVREDLSRLHDSVEPVDAAEIRERIRSELGSSVDNLFDDFEDRPIGTASLAQVHRARLRSGRRVVVKVLRPGAKATVQKDLSMMADAADWMEAHSELENRYGLASTIREFRRTLRAEMDFEREAANLRRIANITRSYERIRVPKVVGDYTTRHVLTMEYMEGVSVGNLNPVAYLDKDLSSSARDLFRAYLDQALVHGFVHADPHPGNIIIQHDGGLALIDLGMITVVPADLRSELVQLALAAAQGDGTAAARVAERIGEPLGSFHRDRFVNRVATELAAHQEDDVGSARLGEAMVSVTQVAGECGLRIPSSVALLGKTLLNLEQVGSLLDPEFNPASEFRSYAPRVVAAGAAEEIDPAAAMRKALEVKDFLEVLPHRLDRMLDRLGTGDFEVRMHVAGEERLVGGLARVANRVARAVVLAALIVGASLLMRIETDFQILGYPGLAIILFTIAALGGTHLLWDIARDEDEP